MNNPIAAFSKTHPISNNLDLHPIKHRVHSRCTYFNSDYATTTLVNASPPFPTFIRIFSREVEVARIQKVNRFPQNSKGGRR